MRGDVGACGLPFAVVVAATVGDGAFDEADSSDRSSGHGGKVLQEGHDALDIQVEVEGVRGVEHVARFGVDLVVYGQDGGMDAGVFEEVVGGFDAAAAEAVRYVVVFCTEAVFFFSGVVEGGMFGADQEVLVGVVGEEEVVDCEADLGR